MPQTDHETELEHTKMSFGEHLEELRRALFRSIIALLLGFLIGLIFGRQVVDYIQGPLRDSLQRFYLRQAKAEQLAYLEEQRDLGLKVPDDLEKAAERVVQEGLVPQEYYASPDELAAALGAHYPDLAKILEARPQPEAAGGDAAAGEGDAAEGAAEDEDAALLAAFNREDLIHLRLYTPIESDLRLRIVELNVQAPFIIYLKAALAVGAVVASPFIFYFIWDFVAAGLYRSERKYVYIYLPLSIGLFLAGAWIAYFEAFPYVLDFLFWYFETMNIDPDMRLSEWITLVLLMPIGFGLSFQLPLAMLLLERVGIFTVESYTGKWKVAVVVIAVLAMVLSPGGDPYSMMFMFFPLTGLYFLGILLCRYMPGGHLRRKGIDPPPPADVAT
jgi:sec-independent protein translocase protein TatC